MNQLSFVNKESDRELNEYLANSINSVRQKWACEWENQTQEINGYQKKLSQINQGQEDVELKREEFEERVQMIEELVGLI